MKRTVRSLSRRIEVKCTNCPAEVELTSDAKDVSDVAYKLLCPFLREHQNARRDLDVDFPYMRDAIAAARLNTRAAS